MKCKTVQASAFKASFEVLKDILNDTNVVFDEKGIRLLTLDTARAALVDFHLKSENFEEYKCPEGEIVIAGLNISNAFKLLKSITNNDILELEILNHEYLSICIINTVKSSITTFRLKLLDIDEDHIELPEIELSAQTILPSVDFQRICRDMFNISQEIVITRTAEHLKFSCEGDFASQETTLDCSEQPVNVNLSGTYSLKYLNLFTRATSMCSSVQLMMEKDMRFLVLKYNVASLGELNFYLATKVNEY